jgi:alpha-D-ribose 1-methylphosphonate 5-triphosphate synthase subunit PhnG
MTDQQGRKDWMGVLARAAPARLGALWQAYGPRPDFVYLRPPEIGGVMVRGRTGATGAPFNLGEMTVTRCALRLADGTMGHAYVQGRHRDHAVLAALTDAVMQTVAAPNLRSAVIDPLIAEETAARAARAAKAAATRVEFFTLVRGEDA